MIDSIIAIISGLGIFLFGMHYLENALKEASGSKFKEILKKSTATIPKSIATGTIATAVLQSSSVVSLMALSFVGAGLMALTSGIGVIFGANIGTTATSWIVALVGFKIKIEVFAIPMVGIAGFILITMSKYPRLQAISKIFIGFGLLFLGLEFLKNSIEGFSSIFDLKAYLDQGALTFLFIGFALTAIIQSSSAATAIILSSLYSGIITFDIAATMVIGSNIGTTVTALLGSIGGTADKKRVALSHMVFNVLTGVLAFAMIGMLSEFVLVTLDFSNDLTTALAVFHTIFNIIGVVVFAPFIPMFSKMLLKLFKSKDKEILKYIHQVDANSDAASIAFRNEFGEFFNRASDFGLYLQNVEPSKLKVLKVRTLIYKYQQPLTMNYQGMYEDLKKAEIELIKYGNKIETKEVDEKTSEDITNIIESVKEIGFAIKTLKDIKTNMDELSQREEEYLVEFYNQQRRQIIRLFKNLILTLEGESERELKALKIYNGILEDNKEGIRNLAEIIKMYNLDDLTAATMMNISRSVFMASDSLYLSIKNLNSVDRDSENNNEKESDETRENGGKTPN